ncbi:MAG: hypothetical protein K6U87_15320 [Firmicutes bacterium]|nr:hypothetical protein [Bacillota bacterium]
MAVVTTLLWAWGLLWGVWQRWRGQGSPTVAGWPAFVWPLATGMAVWVLPIALPRLSAWVWRAWGAAWAGAIAQSAGLGASGLHWLGNPVWIWGAVWGLSGPHGLDLAKLGATTVVPAGVAVAGDIASRLVQGVTGQVSLARDVSNYVYGLVHVGLWLMLLGQALLAVWTTVLLLAGLWLGLSPCWAWVAVLDPWSPDALWAVLGLTARAALVTAGAWVWTAGVASLGGGAGGPLGLPAAAAALTPWLTLGWTALATVAGWRAFVAPAWIFLRSLQQRLAHWWLGTVAAVARPVEAAGAELAAAGMRWDAARAHLARHGITLPGAVGEAMARGGAGLLGWAAAQRGAAEALARGVAWTAGEQAAIERGAAGLPEGLRDRPWAHPAGWAARQTAEAPAAGEAVRWVRRRPDGWEAVVASAAHAERLAQSLQQAWAQAGLAPSLAAWQWRLRQRVHAWAEAQADRELGQWTDKWGQPIAKQKRYESVARAWREGRIAALRDWAWDQIDHSEAAWLAQGAMPEVVVAGQRVAVRPRGAELPAGAVAALAQAATVAAEPRRVRWGIPEVFRQGVWVVDEPAAPGAPPPDRLPLPGAPPPRFPDLPTASGAGGDSS